MASDDDGTPALVLGPELTIAQAAEVRQQLLDHLADLDAPLSLDLSGVSEFDSAGVQVLLALHATLAARGHALTLQSPSAVVRAALDCYQLSSRLMPAASDAKS
ncbi:STAS domain-containing protein [Paucibacter sp. APW11]|uniref:STAS domain-containing protein n=1 Tax=Roseateles aquae TaxID=3077235 RepID=A0ABU3PHY8_9BURK|nr:STAS domain-containing protein [Paucibacter sp. APW11]MDT9001723.1 STAS domain-containing protein [Paucibacter sp. APW11]